jgi:hypothetical protein
MDVEDGNGTDCIAVKSHKLFKMPVSNEMFYGFIQKITHKTTTNVNYYLIDNSAYKKAIYCDEFQPISLLQQFCNDLMPHYFKNKQFFITRRMSYNNFNTILRHVCRSNGIDFRSERKYDKSKTQIMHYIYCIAQ